MATLQEKVNQWVEDELGRISALALSEEAGHGPTLLAVAATNHPVIKNMRRLEIVMHDGKEMIKAQVARWGTFIHPSSGRKFTLSMAWAQRILENWRNNVYGQAIFLDPSHDTKAAALGEMVHFEATEANGADAIFDPTPEGLDAVKDKKYSYASVLFHPDYKGSEVAVGADEELAEIDLFQMALAKVGGNQQEETNMADENKTVPGGTPAPAQTAPPTSPPNEPATLALAEREGALAAGQAELAEMQATALAEMAEMRAGIEQERIQLAERGRIAQVEAVMAKAALPNDEGFCLDKGTFDAIGTALRCNDFEDGAIKLSEDDSPSVTKVKAYFFDAFDRVLNLVPRTVPTAGAIQGSDARPASADAVKLAEDRQSMFDNIELHNPQKETPLTEAEIWEKVNLRYPEEV